MGVSEVVGVPDPVGVGYRVWVPNQVGVRDRVVPEVVGVLGNDVPPAFYGLSLRGGLHWHRWS